ncbi:hypothetical protein MP638_005241 [Amoeboaphelidium occidentale]|nr:hypothetical protein MP638_005241 [Amoeboaphelidium occidentale]
MSSSSVPNTTEVLENYSDENNELKQAFIRCFKCSETVAETFASQMVKCAVPEGQSRLDWYLNAALEAGITEKGDYALVGYLPDTFSNNPTRFSIASLVTGYRGEHGGKEVTAWRIKPLSSDFSVNTLTEVCTKLFGKRLLFRGVPAAGFRDLHMMGAYYPTISRYSADVNEDGRQSPNMNEFGAGVYCTFDLDYAVKCTSFNKGSAVLVFDWSDVADLVPYYFNHTKAWAKFVMQNICALMIHKRATVGVAPFGLASNYDFIEGRICGNYKEVKGCHDPETSQHTQVAVIRNHNETLYQRLIGVIYVSMGTLDL